MQRQYYILTQSIKFPEVAAWLSRRNIPCEVHLNRTRFWLSPGSLLHTEMNLRWAQYVELVDPAADLATGLWQENS